MTRRQRLARISGRIRQCTPVAAAMTALMMLSATAEPPAVATDAAPAASRYEAAGVRMGVTVRLVCYAEEEATARAAMTAGLATMTELSDRLSDWVPTSEVSRLTAGPVGTPVPVGDELWTILAEAQRLSRRTDGAFDVTVGPLVSLWRTARQTRTLPSPEAIAEARAAVGWEKLVLDPDARTATPTVAGMRIDLGAIGKGYIVDRTLAAMTAAGVGAALVEAGGDLAVSGPPPGRDGWRVEIERLAAPIGEPADRPSEGGGVSDRPPRRSIVLVRSALASSGDAFKFVEVDGRRYSHVLDPRTGRAITTPRAVTVVAPTAMQADGIATAVGVLGPDGAAELLAAYPGVRGQIVEAVDPANRRGGTRTTLLGETGWLGPDARPAAP